jgi:hypothetical protein
VELDVVPDWADVAYALRSFAALAVFAVLVVLVDAAFDALVVADLAADGADPDVEVPAAMQPVSATSAPVVSAPAMRRARRAG